MWKRSVLDWHKWIECHRSPLVNSFVFLNLRDLLKIASLAVI